MSATPRPVDASRIAVTSADGSSGSLEAVLPDGPAIVHFWAKWCVPCREELPELAEFRTRLEEEKIDSRLVVIALERGDYSRIRKFLDDDLGLPELPSLQNGDGRAGPAFALFGLPATVMLDGERRIVAVHQGPVDWDGAKTRLELTRFLSSQD